MDNLIFQLVIFLILFSIGWAFGRHIERKHLNELLEKSNNLHISELIPIVLQRVIN